MPGKDFDNEINQYSDIRNVGFEVFEHNGVGSDLKKIPRGIIPFDVFQGAVSRGAIQEDHLVVRLAVPRVAGSTCTVCPPMRLTFTNIEDDGSEKQTEVLLGNGTNLEPRVGIDSLPMAAADEGEGLKFVWDSDSSLFIGFFAVECPVNGEAASFAKIFVKLEAFDNHNILSILDTVLSSITGQADIVAIKNTAAQNDNVSLTATVSSGGVSAGDTFANKSSQQMLEAILAPYVPPALISMVINPGTTLEVGATADIASAVVSWVNGSDGGLPQAPAISNAGFPDVVLTTSPQTIFTDEPITRNTAGSEQWTFSANDKSGAALPIKYDRVYWYYRRFFGASALAATDAASAQLLIAALQQDWLDANRAGTVACTADNNNVANYTYIAYAASLGDLTGIIQNGASPVLTAFTKVGAFDYTNAEGVVVSYNIYKSNAKGAFSDGDSLVIS